MLVVYLLSFQGQGGGLTFPVSRLRSLVPSVPSVPSVILGVSQALSEVSRLPWVPRPPAAGQPLPERGT